MSDPGPGHPLLDRTIAWLRELVETSEECKRLRVVAEAARVYGRAFDRSEEEPWTGEARGQLRVAREALFDALAHLDAAQPGLCEECRGKGCRACAHGYAEQEPEDG